MNHVRSIVAMTLAGLLPIAAFAQDTADDANIDELVVTGTRVAGRVVTESLSPVDVVSGTELTDQAAFDLTDSLTKISASLNTQRFPIADGTAFIRPVSLRNLSPDHTLVLVNGTRAHRSALVNLQLAPLGTVNQGSQGVDWSTFPAAAVKRVEILRDGASAQYGSDAIAGVVNVIFKDASDGGSLSAQYGEYSENDGERLSVSGNIGLPLSDSGFVNLTGEYSTSDETSRGAARPDAAAVGGIVGINLVPEEGLGQRWGDPNVEAKKVLVNAGISFSDSLELYGTANYMDNETVSDFFYRRPVITPQQPCGLSARTTLMIDNGPLVDCDGDTQVDDPDGFPDNAPQSLVDSINAQGLNPADYLTASGTSPSGFVLLNPIYTQFPGGYNPDFGADLTDFGIIVGLRGDMTDTLRWDARVRYGENEADYKLSSSINPSLGRLSPTSFRPGKLTQEESGLNIDFVKTFADSPLNIAFGGELRNETYKIGAGDLASIQPGPTAAIFGVGSDGFQGFPVESAGSFESDSWATFVDVETDLTDRLTGAVAFRYEDYDEFGDTFDWKVSARFAFTDSFAIRATANTGFRVPTPGQVNTLNVTTTSDSSGNLIPNGTYPVSNPVALALGAVPLVPEESESYTVGLVWTPTGTTSITVDYYNIKIDDRLALLSNTIGAAQVALLVAAGIPNANLLLGSNANFFVNGFDSEVDGIDLAVTSSFAVGGGDLLVDLRHNFNEQDVTNVTPGTINASRVFDLENQIPENASVLTFDYSSGGFFAGLVRFNYYDSWRTTAGLFSSGNALPSELYDYGDEILVDLEARFTFAERFTVTLGGENIFDTLPGDEQDPTSQFLGARPALTSPFGFNGAFWYLRAGASF